MPFRFLQGSVRLLSLGLLLAVGHANAGSMALLGVGSVGSAPAGYTGPGDINGTAFGWWGLRGYSAAYASPGTNCAVDIEDQSGANPLTCVHILSNGRLDVASISAWVAVHSVTTIKVSKLYDQSGNGRHATQSTLSAMPSLVLNGLGSLPVLNFSSASSQTLVGPSAVAATTSTFSVVAEDQGGANFGAIIILDNDSNGFLVNPSSANNWLLVSSGNASAIQSTFHAAQGVYGASTASVYVDGTLTSLPVYSALADGNIVMGASNAGTTNFLNGNICETGIWASDESANNSAMNSNQHTYWGF